MAHVAARLAHLAGGQNIREAGAGVVAEDVDDMVEHLGVVAEDGDHGTGDQVERAFVGRAGDVVWAAVAGQRTLRK